MGQRPPGRAGLDDQVAASPTFGNMDYAMLALFD